MICKNCGAELTEGSVFCTNCGASVEPATEYIETVTAEAVPEAPITDPGKGLGIAALILGIVALLAGAGCTCMCGCLGGAPAIIAAIVGIILGVLAMNKSKAAGFSNKLGMIGMILAIVALVIMIIVTIVNMIIGGAGAMANQMNSSYYYY